MKLVVELRGADKLRKDLENFASKAVPHATRNALNRCAFETRTAWITGARETMELRTTFVPRSIQVQKARGTKLPMQAVVGSTADLMDELEHGATRSGPLGVAIPTVEGAREGSKGNVVRKKHGFREPVRHPGSSLKQRNAVAIRKAMRARKRILFLETQAGGGIFKLQGGRKSLRVVMLHDLSHSSIKIQPSHLLERTLDRLGPTYEKHYADALREQLRRHKILGY